MKIDANYKKVHGIIRDLKEHPDGFMLGKVEVGILLQILAAAEGDIFPSMEALERQEINVRSLEHLDPDDSRWKSTMSEVNEFENKFC